MAALRLFYEALRLYFVPKSGTEAPKTPDLYIPRTCRVHSPRQEAIQGCTMLGSCVDEIKESESIACFAHIAATRL